MCNVRDKTPSRLWFSGSAAGLTRPGLANSPAQYHFELAGSTANPAATAALQKNLKLSVNISPLQPGTYTGQVSAKGFKSLVQDNVVVDALQTRTISPVLTIGTETQTVTVTAAPPVLDTASRPRETARAEGQMGCAPAKPGDA